MGVGRPHLRFLCATETLVAEPQVDGVEVRILARAEFAQLYSRRARQRAGRARSREHRSAARSRVSRRRAGCGPRERRKTRHAFGSLEWTRFLMRGSADSRASVIWHLTARLLGDGIARYYPTLIANVVSQRAAHGVGYRPAWLEMEARPIRRGP